ncbi:STAS domain-containing protein [Planosporangium thailandense]|uniref:Anti-sigma factor antagonist n=1 Tax=Planosporangium thailandense TaxID=765197 RepID=A0ABX0Y803_9ACTN|nr:STAS domain-containing protein [Planosporangium thailandense]NJC73565.1 STAS domain-containing protein [Planosporangium thailandense]
MGVAGNEIGPTPLRLTRSADGSGRVSLTVAGEVDISNLCRLDDELSSILTDPHVTQLIVDVAPLEFIDSSGVEVLMRARQAARRRSTGFALANAHGRVQRVLAVLGVDRVLASTVEPRQIPG